MTLRNTSTLISAMLTFNVIQSFLRLLGSGSVFFDEEIKSDCLILPPVTNEKRIILCLEKVAPRWKSVEAARSHRHGYNHGSNFENTLIFRGPSEWSFSAMDLLS